MSGEAEVIPAYLNFSQLHKCDQKVALNCCSIALQNSDSIQVFPKQHFAPAACLLPLHSVAIS